jgi:hypothetical protein
MIDLHNLKQKLERLENRLAWPVAAYFIAISSFVIGAALSSCSDYSDESQGYGNYQPIATPAATPMPSPTPEAFKEWTLDQIQWERYACWDDFYEYVGDTYQMFCLCFIEKVSLRWERDDYLRHQFQYWSHLSETGAMQRCTKLPEFWSDPTGSVDKDRQFDPEKEQPETSPAPSPGGISDLLKDKEK